MNETKTKLLHFRTKERRSRIEALCKERGYITIRRYHSPNRLPFSPRKYCLFVIKKAEAEL